MIKPEDWDLRRLRDRVARLRLLEAEEYVRLNPDVAGSDVVWHFAEHGLWESRALAGPQRLAAVIGELAGAGTKAWDAGAEPASIRNAPHRIGVAVHARAGADLRALASGVGAGLEACGAEVVRLSEADNPHAVSVRVIVAPQVFFAADTPARWWSALPDSVVFGTEQLHTASFARALPFLLNAKGVADTGWQTVLLLREAGVPAELCVPETITAELASDEAAFDHPLQRGLPPRIRAEPKPGWNDRPLDLAFTGSASPARDRFFARNAAVFTRLQHVVHLRRPKAEPIDGAPTAQEFGLDRWLAQRSKIVLDLPETELGFLDWRKHTAALSEGALAVTTSTPPHPLFEAGKHHLQDEWRRLPELIRWVTQEADGQATGARIAAAGREAVLRATAPETSGRALLRLLAAVETK